MYKISVIIPIYNVEKYLRECLDSVVNQTLKDVEVICVDDGSPDRSAEIASEYVEKYSNFKLIRKENGGLSSARNAALEIAQGEYIFFLDSDDIIAPTTLEDTCKKADDEALDMVFFNATPFFESEEIRNQNESFINYYCRHGDYSQPCSGQAMFARMQENGEYRVSACLEIIRSSLLNENKLCFYEGIIHEDILFTFQCTMLAKRVGYLNDSYYLRRMHDGSIMTASKSIRNLDGYLVAYTEILSFLRRISVEPLAVPAIKSFLRGSLYWNICNIWASLDEEERKRPLTHGEVCAEHLLSLAQRNIELEKQLHNLKGKAEPSFNLPDTPTGESELSYNLPFLLQKINGFFLCAAEYGYRYAINRTFWRLAKYPLKLPKIIRENRVRKYMNTGRETPLVSFILPVYNVAEFLPQALDTLRSQTLPHIEIIAVDDGSTDGSPEILKQYVEMDSRIRVFTQENKFAGAARNLGLCHATGEYVIFLDSDDFFEVELAERTYCAAKVNRADVVIFGARRYNNVTKSFQAQSGLFSAYEIPEKQPFNYKDCSARLFQLTTPAPWTKMFRREYILDIGLQFQPLRNSNDLYFTYSAIAQAKRITTVDAPLVNYRVNVATSLQATKGRDPLCFLEAYQALHDRLAKVGRLNSLRKSYVSMALAGCLFNWSTQKDPEAKLAVRNALTPAVLEKLEVTGYPKEYYYNEADYEELQNILNGVC